MTQRVEQDSESPLTPTSLEGDRRVVYKVVLTGGTPSDGSTTRPVLLICGRGL